MWVCGLDNLALRNDVLSDIVLKNCIFRNTHSIDTLNKIHLLTANKKQDSMKYNNITLLFNYLVFSNADFT